MSVTIAPQTILYNFEVISPKVNIFLYNNQALIH